MRRSLESVTNHVIMYQVAMSFVVVHAATLAKWFQTPSITCLHNQYTDVNLTCPGLAMKKEWTFWWSVLCLGPHPAPWLYNDFGSNGGDWAY